MLTLFLAQFIALFSVVSPLGAMPLFIALTGDESKRNRRLIARDTSLYFVGILILFFFVGTMILDFFGISLNAMRIVGGFLIFSSGQALMAGEIAKHRTVDDSVEAEAQQKHAISLTPMAMPMLSGPGSISLLIGIKAGQTTVHENMMTVGAILLVGLVTYIILLLSTSLTQFLGKSGLNSVSRILGFFSMAIGVQYVVDGTSSVLSTILK